MSRTDDRVLVHEEYRYEPNFDSDQPHEHGRLVHVIVEEVRACSKGHRYTAENVRLRGRGRKRLVCLTCERDRSRNHKRRLAKAQKGATA